MGAVPVLALDEIDSTNAEARRRAEGGDLGPLWITALRQSAGKGRQGRVWETGQGANLAATLLIGTQLPPARAAQVSFVAALAVSDLVRAFVERAPALVKWPNDVLVEGRKVAGVLVEAGVAPGGARWLAVGIGVNLAERPTLADRAATSFADEGCRPAPTPLEALDCLASYVQTWLDLWLSAGFPAIAEAWTGRAYGLGQACTAHLGAESIKGLAEGLDADGALRLRLASGEIRRVTAGDVMFGNV